MTVRRTFVRSSFVEYMIFTPTMSLTEMINHFCQQNLGSLRPFLSLINPMQDDIYRIFVFKKNNFICQKSHSSKFFFKHFYSLFRFSFIKSLKRMVRCCDPSFLAIYNPTSNKTKNLIEDV